MIRRLMPFSASLGSTVQFTVVFFDANSVITIPTSATLTITYPPSSNNLTSVSCSIPMSPAGQYFTATWGSGVSYYGDANFSISGAGQATPTTGTLRLIS